MDSYIFWVVIGIVVCFGIWYLSVSNKKTWWKVEDADGTIRILSRSGRDVFGSNQTVLIFRTEVGHVYKTNWRWIKSIEEIPEKELVNFREQLIKNEKELNK